MWVLVNVTGSAGPTPAFPAAAAEEGTAVMAREDDARPSAPVLGIDELARRRHRRTHRLRLGTLVGRGRTGSGT